MHFFILFLIGATLLAGCAEQTEMKLSSAEQEALISQARTASKELMSTLQVQLKSAIQKEGTAGAVTTCSVIAPALAKQVGETHGLQIQRVSAQYRSPQGQPDTFESQILKQWSAGETTSSETPEITETYQLIKQDGKHHFRYMKPIHIQQACLQCHGQSISPQVQAAIQEKYPEDLATGYALNDLRGAVSVRIEVPKS